MSALLRLTWRPVALWLPFLLFLAIGWPQVLVPEESLPEAFPGLLWLWREAGVLPAVTLGAFVATLRLELQHRPITWTLPDLRKKLLQGTLLLAFAVAGLITLGTGPEMPSSMAPSVFILAVLWFLLPGLALDAGVPGWARWSAGLAVLALLIRPSLGGDLANLNLLLTAVVGISLTILVLYLQFSARSSRARLLRWSALAPWARALYWAERRDRMSGWSRSLATERMGPWLRAAWWEGAAGRPWRLLVVSSIWPLGAHLIGNPAFLLVGIAMTSARGAFLLKPWSLQPVSRELRARVALWGARAELAVFGLVAAVLMSGLAILRVPPLPIAVEATPVSWSLFLGMALAWAPLVQWASVRWDPLGVRAIPSLGVWAGFAIFFLLFLLATTSSSLPLSRVEPVLQAACVGGVAVAAQMVFGVAVRRHYARADLLPASAAPSLPGLFRGK